MAESNQKVEQERQRYQQLFEFAPDGYLVTDQHGNIVEANHAAGEMLGIKTMGGSMSVESEEGRGNAFHFTARLGLQNKKAAAQSIAPVNAEGMRVLIVDDNSTNCRVLEEMLTHWKMKPTAVESGEAAISEMKEAGSEGRPFQLVLLDSLMPEMDGFEVAERIRETPELAGATIMMLTSDRLRGDAERCRKLGISTYLVKPVSQSGLFDAIASALSQQQSPKEKQAMTTFNLVGKTASSLRILLAEDNPVNQKLVIGMLKKRGHEIVVADTGKRALVEFEASRFDVVLMDVQMPEMTGFEATAEMRKIEQGRIWRTPIIALTAHAMKGDRERCFEAGMDGYLAKPFTSRDLFETIESAVSDSRRIEESESHSAWFEDLICRSALVEQFDGDLELMQVVIDQFQQTARELMSRIRDSIQSNDGPELGRAAHSLKGAAAILHLKGAVEPLQRLERMGRNNEMARAGETLTELERQMERITLLLHSIVEQLEVSGSHY